MMGRSGFSCAFVLAAVFTVALFGEKSYFADGYHGGIYGHYPLEWKTQFIVEKLQSNPGWYVGLEIEPETWDSVKTRTPEAYLQLKDMVNAGRIEFTNPTYAQPYCFNISGESIIRQFSYGLTKLREHFGDFDVTAYAVEEPCFTSCLPAILRGFGFKYASLKCPDTCWGGYMAPFGGEFVDWIGPDGTSLPAVPRYACEDLEKNSVWQTTAWKNSPTYLDACRKAGIKNPIGMCYQDAGWKYGPWLRRNPQQSEYILWSDYFGKFMPTSGLTAYSVTQEDVRVNLMWGSQVLQRIARQVRGAENMMVMAEKAGAIGFMSSRRRPGNPEIDEAWRRLMLAQHHDSWIVPYNRLWKFGTWAGAIKSWTDFSREAACKEIEEAVSAIEPGNKLMVKVVNTTLLDRKETVKVLLPDSLRDKAGCYELSLPDGKRETVSKSEDGSLCFTASVPSFGYSTYSLRPMPAAEANRMPKGTVPEEETVKTPIIENELLRLELDLEHGAAVKSLKDKKSGCEYAPSAESKEKLCELRGFFYDEGEFRSTAEGRAEVIELYKNDSEQRIKACGEISGHPFEISYCLKPGSHRIDCHLKIDWKGNPAIGEYKETNWRGDRRAFCDDRYKLSLLLPLSFEAPRLTRDAPFDIFESRQETTAFKRWSEIKNNVILNWIYFFDESATRGMGLISDHTTSYSHGPGFPTALTVQYTGQGLWGADYKVDGPTEIDFALVPYSGYNGWKAVNEESDRFNEPLVAVVAQGNGKPTSRSFLSADKSGIRLSSAKCNDDGTLTLRLHNASAEGEAEIRFTEKLKGLSETDLSGKTVSKTAFKTKGNAVCWKAGIPRNGFKTYSLTMKKLDIKR